MTRKELKRMRETDIRTVNRDELVDINSVVIQTDLPVKERVQDYLRQVKNPYCYIDHGIAVKITFAGNKNLEDCLRTVVFSNAGLI